jgi:hypothetical protein
VEVGGSESSNGEGAILQKVVAKKMALFGVVHGTFGSAVEAT